MLTAKKGIVFAFITISFYFLPIHCFALTPETHEDLNEFIATKSPYSGLLNLYLLENLNFQKGIGETFNSKEVYRWVILGGRTEDIPDGFLFPPFARSFNHFHDPLKPWDHAGFKQLWSSSARWAINEQYLGDYSYKDARAYFYNALTAKDETTRSTNYAECFRALGQVMHLIEDASVPAHTRDDAHVSYNYETWVHNNGDIVDDALRTFVSAPEPYLGSLEATEPIQSLFDSDLYKGDNPNITVTGNVGLAEYANANFLSEDTIFRKYTYPSMNTSVVPVDNWVTNPRNQSEKVLRKYYFKTGDGDNGYPVAAINYLQDYVITYVPWLDVSGIEYIYQGTLDRTCYEEYARRLLPRAVAYSSELLRYFFRGDIDAVDAKTVKDGSNNITGITMKVKNNTPNEAMSDGKLVVSYRFKGAGEAA